MTDCDELQRRLDARAADLGRFTQTTLVRTKELEAERDHWKANHDDQVRRKRVAQEKVRELKTQLHDALVQVTVALGLPTTEAGRPRADSFLWREIGRALECEDWDWPPSGEEDG